MANTNDPFTSALDSENQDAINQSVERQWNALRYALHLPDIINLQGQERNVADRIATHVENTRGAIANDPALRRVLQEQYRAQERVTLASSQGRNVAHSARQENVLRAEAWLKVIYQNFGEAEVRVLVNEARANAIRPANGSMLWTPLANITVAGNAYQIQIDLNHHVWMAGGENEVRQRLLNQRPDQVGIRVNPAIPAPGKLTNDWVDEILNSRNNLINPQLTQATQEFMHPAPPAPPTRRVVVDMRMLMNANPNVAGMNAVALQQYFTANPNDYRRVVQWINIADNTNVTAASSCEIG